MSPRFSLILLASLIPGLLLCQPAVGDAPPPALKEKVQRLVEQLADADEKKQEAAVAELFKLGPDILPHLPPLGAKLKPAQAKHLVALTRTLREAQARKSLTPRLFTLKDDSISLAKALAELTRQTGVPVEDRRREKDDLKLKLDLEQVTFWQAIDAIAREADLQLYLFGAEAIAVVNGPHVATPVSYHGIFRAAVKRIVAVRDLETDAHFYVARTEISWEPRFRPFLIDTRPQALVIKDDKDRSLPIPEEGGGKAPVESPFATSLDLRLPAIPRSVNKLNLLKGSLAVVGPSKMLDFTFDTLDVLDKDPKAREQTQESVTVKLSKPELGKLWKLKVTLEYPPDGPDFESFQSWLVHNKMHLFNESSKQMIADSGYATDDISRNRAAITYTFVETKNPPRGKPAEYKVIYRTPGAISEIPVPFEFKDLPLP